MAALENRQNPIGRERSAWWPGGRMATKAARAQPSITASTAMHGAAGRAQGGLGAAGAHHRVVVQRHRLAGLGADAEDGLHIVGGVDAGELFLGGGGRGFAQQRQEFLGLQRAQHGAQAVGAFRVPGAGVVLQARRVGDQGDRHGTSSSASVRFPADHEAEYPPPRSTPAGRGRFRGRMPGNRPPPPGRWRARAGARRRQPAQRAVGAQHGQRAAHALHVEDGLAHRRILRGRRGAGKRVTLCNLFRRRRPIAQRAVNAMCSTSLAWRAMPASVSS